jgi:archaeal flagellar protein FlaJ
VALSRYQRFAFRTFGPYVAKTARSNLHLRLALQKANIARRPEVYLSFAYLNMATAFILGLLSILLLVALRALEIIALPTVSLLVLAPLPVLLASTIYLLTFALPDLRAGTRARDIDAKLPYALNYIATLASAGTTLDKTLASLASDPVYGEIATEAAFITRDLRLLGRDIVGALTAAIDRSPSQKFQDFLQGAIITVTSGGDLKTYFRTKADQFSVENRQDQRKFLDTLGLIAESFVTVVVAAPLFILILVSVMTSFGAPGTSLLGVGYVVVLIMLPLAQLAFGVIIKTVSREP